MWHNLDSALVDDFLKTKYPRPVQTFGMHSNINNALQPYTVGLHAYKLYNVLMKPPSIYMISKRVHISTSWG